MPKIRALAVVLISTASAMVLAGGLAYPLVVGAWTELQDRRAQERNFVIASDSDQKLIVKSLLTNEMQEPPLCDPSGTCPEEPIYFDRLSAVLRSTDDPNPWNKYEVRSLRREDALINRGDLSVPLPLEGLLDRITQTQTYNPDPMLPGLLYVGNPDALPMLGEPGSCSESTSPRLVRISRAAVQESEGFAIALIATTFCDGSGSPRVAKLKREGSDWRVIKDY